MNSKQIKWRSVRGGFRAVLASQPLILSVSYECIHRLPEGEPKWNVYVFGRRLIDREHTHHDAQRRAVEVAKHQLRLAMEKLSGD